MIGIYKVTSPKNRVYIGQSKNIEKRINCYKKNYFSVRNQTKLYRSFLKYGVEKHKFEILCECEIEELNEKERYYQDLFCCNLQLSLNCILTKTPSKKGVVSEETKIKLRVFNTGKKASKGTKIKMSLAKKGCVFSEDHKLKLSLSQKGKKRINTKNIGKGQLGKLAHNRKIILDYSFGVFYESVTEASKLNGINKSKLISYLKNRVTNKTSLIYC